jgi:hypothetical protein
MKAITHGGYNDSIEIEQVVVPVDTESTFIEVEA